MSFIILFINTSNFIKFKLDYRFRELKRVFMMNSNCCLGNGFNFSHRFKINSESIRKTKYYDTNKDKINDIENIFRFYKSIKNYEVFNLLT